MKRTNQPNAKHSRKGFVVPYFVIISSLLFGLAGLSMDAGRMYFKKRVLQAAADAGALAGANELLRNVNWYLNASAVHDAVLNGAQAGDVTVNWPPSANAGVYSGNSRFVEVVIQENVPTTLLKVVGPEYGTVVARAVAGLTYSGDYCILALDPHASSSLWVHGSDGIQLDCGMMANSDASNGFRTSGSVNINADFLGVTGQAIDNGSSGSVNPTPLDNVPRVPDPLAYLNPPDYSGWPQGIYDRTTDTYSCPQNHCVFNAPVHVGGGNPNDGVNPTFQSDSTYVFLRGIRITGGNATCLRCTWYSPNGGDIFMTGTSSLTLTAPTTGYYHGVALYVDRGAPAGTINLGQGGSQLYFRGAFYAPTQELQIAGNPYGSSDAWAMMVGDTVNFAGTSDFELHPPPQGEAPDTYRVTLVR